MNLNTKEYFKKEWQMAILNILLKDNVEFFKKLKFKLEMGIIDNKYVEEKFIVYNINERGFQLDWDTRNCSRFITWVEACGSSTTN